MKKLHKYEVILDDGMSVYKVYLVAESFRRVREECRGNGDVVRILEIPEYLPSADRVRGDLFRVGYGQAECDLIYRLLQFMEGTEARA